MDAHFRVLGFELTVSGPADCVEPISFSYRAFRTQRTGVRHWVRWSAGRVETDRGVFPGIAGLAPLNQVYPRFLDRLYDGIGDHALIHAGVVAGDGGAILLAGPSGHGKSTLALELAVRGWTLFSDDFAPLALTDGTVAPFPRAIGIVPGSQATPAVYAAAAAEARHTLFGKSLIDPSAVTGAAASRTRSAPVRDLFLLQGDPFPSPRLELSCAPGETERVSAAVSALAGVRVTGRIAAGPLETITIETDPGIATTESLSEVLLDPALIYTVKLWSRQPTWDGEVKCAPVVRRVAAQQLGRELLNRRPGGALLDRYRGDNVALVLDLAAALRSTRCWTIRPGTLGRTADTIEAIIGDNPR